MAKAYARPEKEGYLLVTFYYGLNLGTQARYTNWDQEILGSTSEPSMEVDLPANEGTFTKQPMKISLPLDIFTTRASSGVPHSPIFVQVEEITQGLFTGDQASQKVLFRGRVDRAFRNYQGRANRVSFQCLTLKPRMGTPMGLPCNHHCAWTLFKGGCGVNPASFQVFTEIISVDGQEVTITDPGMTVPGAADPTYWKRGYLKKDDLIIPIRDYDGATDPTKFYMARRVPTDWIGGSNDITALPGCDKTVATCRARYNAEQFFLGLGFAIPAYQPNIETP